MGKEENYALPVDKQSLYDAVTLAVRGSKAIIIQGRTVYSTLFAKRYNKTPEQGLAAIDTTTNLLTAIPEKVRAILIDLDSKEKEVDEERRKKLIAQERADKAENSAKSLEQKLKEAEIATSSLERDAKDIKKNYEALEGEYTILDKNYSAEKTARITAEKDLAITKKDLATKTTDADTYKSGSVFFKESIVKVLGDYFTVPKSEIKTLAGDPEALAQKLDEKAKENKDMLDSILEGYDKNVVTTAKESGDAPLTNPKGRKKQ